MTNKAQHLTAALGRETETRTQGLCLHLKTSSCVQNMEEKVSPSNTVNPANGEEGSQQLPEINAGPYTISGQGGRDDMGLGPLLRYSFPIAWCSFPTYNYVYRHLSEEGRVQVLQTRMLSRCIPHTLSERSTYQGGWRAASPAEGTHERQ